MKVLFKNKTKYSKGIYKEFLEFHQEKYGTSYIFATIIPIILLIFCIVVQIKSKSFLLAILTTIIAIIFAMWRIYNPIKTIRNEVQSKKIENEQEFIFKFYEKYFNIYSQKLNSKIYYWQLHKIFETEEFFYLYIDKTHAFLLSKEGFEVGTSQDFADFINRKCIFKFKKQQ